MKNLITMLLLLLVGCAKPQPIPEVNVDYSRKFADANICGHTMAIFALSMTNLYEFGGFCIKGKDGAFYASDPISNKNTDTIQYHALIPQGSKLAAIYHTHPSGEYSNVYSDIDVNVAETMMIPSYLGIVDDHTVRRFIYSIDRTEMCPIDDTNKRCAEGTILK